MENKTIYEQEKDILFANMDKRYPGWRKNKKLAKRVKKSARQGAKNRMNAMDIGGFINKPANEIMKHAAILRATQRCSIDVAFDILRTKIATGMDWASITAWIMGTDQKVFSNDKAVKSD